ncbi:MAG: hypothetical protein GY795_20220 [Desulfobacterales bacterium]|nr:hypothetical protein [Desulfobacterales bacterium]
MNTKLTILYQHQKSPPFVIYQMNLELNIEFPTADKVIVNYNDQTSGEFDFESPVSERKDIRWYLLEVYAALYTTDIDDQRAEKIAANLPEWGKKLFNSVFENACAYDLFRQFQSLRDQNRLMTISSSHPTILSLPWELLHNPEGAFLFHIARFCRGHQEISGKKWLVLTKMSSLQTTK